jgi:peptidoglycan/LPS O-acetylase OafA/YrhL
LAIASALNLFYIPYFSAHWLDIFTDHHVGNLFPMNNPAWSLLFGMIANLTFALTLRHSPRLPAILLGVSAVALCLATALLGEAPGWGTTNFLGGFPRVFFSFFAGIVIFELHDRRTSLPRVKSIFVLLAVALLVAVPRFSGHRYYWLAMTLLVMPLIVAIGSQCTVSPGSQMQRLLAWLGSISYTLFCVHSPILMLFSLLPVDPRYLPQLSVTYLLVTIGAAHLLTSYVENPMREWLSRKLPRPAVA